MKTKMKMKVLISSSIKEGLENLAGELQELGFEILATGGTAEYLESMGVVVSKIAELTGIDESRELKTLHPKIYEMIFSGEIGAIVVIPYEFEKNPCRENIDIGGISLLRAAAKASIPAAFSLDGFRELVDVLKSGNWDKTKSSARIFKFTSEYDRRIAEWFENETP